MSFTADTAVVRVGPGRFTADLHGDGDLETVPVAFP